MATFIALIDFTPQGIQAINDSPKRAEEFAKRVESKGVKVKDLYWTSGCHDGVLIIEAPDDQTAASVFLSLGKSGFVRTNSMRAYNRAEFEACLPG